MRKETKTRHITIQARTPEEFDERINAILEDPNLVGHVLTYRGDGFTACIEYTTEEKFFENVKEEFEARGDVYYCDECPFIEEPEDRRRRTTCATGSPNRYGKACLYLYEKIAKGEVKIGGVR